MGSYRSLCPQTVMERFRNPLVANLISSYMRTLGVGVFTTRTVGELLWGYEDSLLKTIQLFQPQLDDVFGLFHKVSLTQMCCFSLFLTSAASSGLIFHPWGGGFSHRATPPTTASTSSSPVNQTTETLPEWTRGTVKGNPLCSPARVSLI